MILARLIGLVQLGAANYVMAALVGLLVSGLIFCIAAVLDRELVYNSQALLLTVFSGPVLGCLFTFASRRILDHLARQSNSSLHAFSDEAQGISTESKAGITILFTFGISILVYLAIFTGGDVEPTVSRKCELFRNWYC